MNSEKVIILGVGNSGTKLLGTLTSELLTREGFPDYHYEPLYWRGRRGEPGVVLDREAIDEHVSFPLLPEASTNDWPWLDAFVDRLSGLAKFIRLGSRIRLVLPKPVKVIAITRELYAYLGSMQKNFPRCLPNAGWHHRPGEYDDFERLCDLYPEHDLRAEESCRVEVEAAWWHLHNHQIMIHADAPNLLHVRYEDLCEEPTETMGRVARFLGTQPLDQQHLRGIHAAPVRPVKLLPRNVATIERIAGELNGRLYPMKQAKAS